MKKIIQYILILIALTGFSGEVFGQPNIPSKLSFTGSGVFGGVVIGVPGASLNQDVVITVMATNTTGAGAGGVVVNFSLSPTFGASLSPNPCTTDLNGTCNTTFRATSAGPFSVAISATGYPSPTSPFSITVNAPPAPPPPAQLPLCEWSNDEVDYTEDTAFNAPCKMPWDPSYNLLAPLPNPNNGELMETFDPTSEGALGKYLNIIIPLFIGLCAVLAIVMIVIGGIQYMTSELVHSKAEGKDRILHAIFGLVLALGAYALLNTINPDLLKSDVNIEGVSVVVESFEISGPLAPSFSGPAIKVNFNSQAYPAAKAAESKTGVDAAFILAIFSQETGSGANTGRCRWTDAAANMYDTDKVSLQTITRELNKNINDTPVSCALKDSSGAYDGHGGAIGYTQFRPDTWLDHRNEARGYLGHMPNPWNVNDALMMAAVYLKGVGAASNEKEAACKYFAGPAKSCSTSAGINAYGNSVMGKKLNIEQQIADAIEKGTLSDGLSGGGGW